MFVNGTTWTLIFNEYSFKIEASFKTFSLASKLVCGNDSKYKHSRSTPLFKDKYPATGLSIPPLSISNPFPCIPTG